ncbi:PKS-NRPS hybrid synthetase CHGG_01239-like [Camellia sinensis]|uniref:PKS-NRPS hybrid synthetase CHGG_01239-like n=1 Tax=Camellia sinensis TaxID=4442 RepID=UPI00103619A0|nr:PKS-NRPS hybrid synthetase CHGG_01239-like [Camellia sinensis]
MDSTAAKKAETRVMAVKESIIVMEDLPSENQQISVYEKHSEGNEYMSTQGSQVCADFVLDYTTQFTTEQVFKSKNELLNWVREVGKRNGSVIVIKTSDYGGGKERPRMYLACERSGQYRATKKLKHDSNNTSRITGTKKCGYLFDMRAHRFTTHDEWTLTVVCRLHNHPPAEHLKGHSYAGRLSKDEKALLMDMSKSMVRPKEILVTLKQRDALNVSTLKTIYNVHHRNRVVQRAGRSQIQHLLGELANFPYLQYERVDNYVWVLATLRDVIDGFVVPTIIVTDRELALMNAIHKIFPSARHLLCRWHISKNVLTKCKKMFKTQQKWEKFNHEWNSLVYSPSEIQYDERLKSLLKEFSSYPDAVKYVMDTWLVPYKDKFVATWTDTCMHCGNVTTNRAESAHAKLKRQLGSCQVSFQASFEKIHSQLKLKHTDIKASFEKSQTVVQHQFKPSQFRELRGNVSISALEYLLVESKRANSIGIDVEACGCVLCHTHGLPCAHEIADYIRQDRSISLATIHSQWRQLHISICKKEEEIDLSCRSRVICEQV